MRTIEVDERMRVIRDGAPVEGLFAVGDITGRGAFTHVSVFQATVLTAHLLGTPAYYDGYHGLAWVTYTDPEVGRVGLSEAQAREQGHDVRTASVGDGRVDPRLDPRSGQRRRDQAGRRRRRRRAGRGDRRRAGGGEILGLLTLAVHARVPVTTLASMHYAYPTLHRGVLAAVQKLITQLGAPAT